MKKVKRQTVFSLNIVFPLKWYKNRKHVKVNAHTAVAINATTHSLLQIAIRCYVKRSMWFAFAFAVRYGTVLCCALTAIWQHLHIQEKMNERTSNNALDIMMANGESKLWHTAFSKKATRLRVNVCVSMVLHAVIVHV